MKGWTETGDRYTVRALEPELFEVRHFPNPQTARACCTVKVRVNEADRAKAIPDADPHGHCAALKRAEEAIARRHTLRIVDKNRRSP